MLKGSKELSDPAVENVALACVAILAGGLSRRFGRDKSRLKLGATTLLQRIRATAAGTGYPVQVIRNDCVPQCGPLGGVITAFGRTRAELVVFLACDMPGVTEDWILEVMRTTRLKGRPVFSKVEDRLGFPFALFRQHLESAHRLRRFGRYSLQDLGFAVGAVSLAIPRARRRELRNINTLQDWDDYRLLEAK